MGRLRVTITQPYVPHYRVPLFEQVIAQLDDVGIDARVFYGSHRLGDAQQRNEVSYPKWAEEVPTKSVRLPSGPWLEYRVLPGSWATQALLLTELAAGNGNAWRAMARGRPYVLMGHGRGYTSRESNPAIWLESKLAKNSAHTLTYTAAGEREVLRRTKLNSDRVTSFNNTVDTSQLKRSFEEVLPGAVDDFRRRYRIPATARCAAFIGALEPYKNVELLCEAARRVFDHDPTAHLIVVGSGSQEAMIQELASGTGRVTYLGHIVHSELGIFGHLAELLLNPGRVGLVAVDAIVMGLPIITTDEAMHAPEAEYIENSEYLRSVPGICQSFAEAWLSSLGAAPRQVLPTPTIADSAVRIVSALLRVSGRSL